MRNALQALLLLLASIGATAAYADPPGQVGRLNFVSGAVSFAAADEPDWTEAVLNRPLTGGDRLWADRDARAELHVGSTAVRLAPMTALDIARLDDSSIELRLEQGTLALRVRELDADDRLVLLTPASAVVVRQPGSYRISADSQSGTVRVTVNAGELEVAASAQRFLVPAGQVAVIPPAGYPAFELADASMDEFDRWSVERDRRNDTLASTRYVSSYMTGYEDLDHYGSWRTVPEYGAVWIPARVTPGWAPYRYGRWIWVSPWGWTWVDDAPWGFAPFHYGRWVWVDNYWAWAPGRVVRRPVYAPALVAFIGGSHWSRSGPAVGWFPLGWREPFHPWYRASHTHVRNVNAFHAANVANPAHVAHRHRHRPDAVTVVPRESFVSARDIARSRLHVPHTELARAEIVRDRVPADRMRTPQRASPQQQVQPQSAVPQQQGQPQRTEPRAWGTPGGVRERPHTERRRDFGNRGFPQQPAAAAPPHAAPAPVAPPAPLPRAAAAPVAPPAALPTAIPRPAPGAAQPHHRENPPHAGGGAGRHRDRGANHAAPRAAPPAAR